MRTKTRSGRRSPPNLPSLHGSLGTGRGPHAYSLGPSDRESRRQPGSRLATSMEGPTEGLEGGARRLASRPSPAAIVPEASGGRTAYRLSPAGSCAAGMAEAVAEYWRSTLLESEVKLRTLVADGVHHPPSTARIIEVMDLFDGLTHLAESQSAHLAEMCRLFRLEFCRAIFTRESPDRLGAKEDEGEDDVESEDELVSTYFDQVDSLTRRNALLLTEVDLGNTHEKVDEMRRTIQGAERRAKLYEDEINRLVRQNDSTAQRCRRVTEELAEAERQAEAQRHHAEKELYHLNVENRNLQLQLFHLRKQVGGGQAKMLKDTYRQLKMSKMHTLSTLFAEGDERVGLLVMLSQLEYRLNEVLDTFDNETVHSPESAGPELRRRMCHTVAVLLEEMHLCESHFHRLAPAPPAPDTTVEAFDETDGFVAALFDGKIYHTLLARAERRRELGIPNAPSHPPRAPIIPTTTTAALTPTTARGGRRPERAPLSPDGTETPEMPPVAVSSLGSYKTFFGVGQSFCATEPPERPASTVEGGPGQGNEGPDPDASDPSMEALTLSLREQWVQHFMLFDTQESRLTQYKPGVTVMREIPGSIPADTLLLRLLRHPMRDLSSRKFFSGVDVYAGANPVGQEFLCAVNYVDPSVPIHLPERAAFLKIKYKNTMLAVTEEEGERVTTSRARRVEEEASPSITQAGTSSAPSPGGSPLETHLSETLRAELDGSTEALRQVNEWGGRTRFRRDSPTSEEPRASRLLSVYNIQENLRVFKELGNPTLLSENRSKQQLTGATSSTTAWTVAFQRLNPLSPNRSPEWSLYKTLFHGYRSLTPRLLELTTIDHILLRACERHFARMEYRYDKCVADADSRATNSQMARTFAERFFRDAFTLTDFQEALVDELEARYAFPELVAKNMYEMLCFLDARAPFDPLISVYLNVIRGFQPPTHIHHICSILFQMSYGWPTANPCEEVRREDAHTVMQFIYASASNVLHADVDGVLSDYNMATRSAPITLLSMRSFLTAAMLNQEEPLLLFFNGLFSSISNASAGGEITFDSFEEAMLKYWKEADEQKNLVRFLSSGLGLNRGSSLSVSDLACVAMSAWCSRLWL